MRKQLSFSGGDHTAWYSPEAGKVSPIVFAGSPGPTLGIEIELQILDAETLDLVPGGPRLIEHCAGLQHIKPELLQSTVELNVGPCHDIGEARRSLRERLADLRALAGGLGYALMSAGTHPFARWEDQQVTDQARYKNLLERMQWPARRLMIFGLHVHVGVSGGEKAIAISNSLTSYLPHLLALSASSPFWHGEDTGLASARVKIFESLPTAGLPYRMINWGEFQRFMNTLINAGAIESIREVWWDIRPHPVFGTIEVRIADALPSIDETLSLAALVQCLVVRLSDLYDHGDFLPLHRHWIVAENKWRAARYAEEAEIIADDSGELCRLDDAIDELVETLEPVSKRLGCHPELLGIRKLLQLRPACHRMRDIYRDSGDLGEVTAYLMEQLERDDVLGTAHAHHDEGVG